MQKRVPFSVSSRERGARLKALTQPIGQQKSNPRSSSPPTKPYGSVVAATPGGIKYQTIIFEAFVQCNWRLCL